MYATLGSESVKAGERKKERKGAEGQAERGEGEEIALLAACNFPPQSTSWLFFTCFNWLSGWTLSTWTQMRQRGAGQAQCRWKISQVEDPVKSLNLSKCLYPPHSQTIWRGGRGLPSPCMPKKQKTFWAERDPLTHLTSPYLVHVAIKENYPDGKCSLSVSTSLINTFKLHWT